METKAKAVFSEEAAQHIPGQSANANTNTAPNPPKVEEEKPIEFAKIDFSPIAFDEDAVSTFMNERQLAGKIDSIFRGIFADYYGCVIKINDGTDDLINRSIGMNEVYANLQFSENSNKNGFRALHLIGEINENVPRTSLSRVAMVTGDSSSHHYTIDNDVKEALGLYILGENVTEDTPAINRKAIQNNLAKIDWIRRVREIPITAPGAYPTGMYPASGVVVEIMGFPIRNLLMALYGNTNADGEALDYGCNLSRYGVDQITKVFQIIQIKKSTVDHVCTAVGIPTINSQYCGPYNPMFSNHGYCYNG